MIDTIRLKTKLTDINDDKLLSISYKKEGELRYKVFKDVITVGSFSYDINLYVSNSNFLFIEFSLPKYLYGHNLKEATFNDIIPVLTNIKQNIDTFATSEPLELWEVQRIDLCSYIFSENPYQDIFLYQTLDYPRQKKYLYDTSVMFVGSSYTTKFYIKEDEFLKHDFKKIVKQDISLAYNLLNLSKEKIRVETGYRSKALKSILNSKHVTLSVIIEKQKRILKHQKGILNKLYGNINPEKMKQKNLLQSLRNTYKDTRALQLYQFYVFYYSDDSNKKITKELYSRSQIYRNLKQIKKALIY